MPLAEAAALLRSESAQRSRGAPHFTPREAHHDRQVLAALAVACERFSPLVGWEESGDPDGVRMDVSGLASLFGGEAALARQVAEFFQQRGYRVRIAVADTPAAAAAVARWSSAGCVIIPPGQRRRLAELPAAALDLPAAVEQQLQHLGLRRIGQLQDLPRASLAARFGRDLVARLDRFTGVADEVITPGQPPEELAVERSFEHPLTHPQAIAVVLEQLLQQLAALLIARGHGVLQLDCRLVCQEGGPRVIRVGLFQPSADPRHLASLAQTQLDRLNLPGGLQQVCVAAVSTAPREQRQGELFADAAACDPAKLALLVERLSNRVGRERVMQPRLRADAQIELAFDCVPLTGGSPPPELMGSATCPGPMFRPLKWFDPPHRIDVIGIALDGPPAVFFYQRRPHRVAHCFGPERIETGWWRGPSCRRDYYRVETESGQLLWLFRQLQDQQWFLHGEFA